MAAELNTWDVEMEYGISANYIRKVCRTGKIRYRLTEDGRYRMNADDVKQYAATHTPRSGPHARAVTAK
jgi:predicted site-specific integrase-resolvase